MSYDTSTDLKEHVVPGQCTVGTDRFAKIGFYDFNSVAPISCMTFFLAYLPKAPCCTLAVLVLSRFYEFSWVVPFFGINLSLRCAPLGFSAKAGSS